MKLTKGMKKALSLLLSAAMVVTGVNVTTNTASAADAAADVNTIVVTGGSTDVTLNGTALEVTNKEVNDGNVHAWIKTDSKTEATSTGVQLLNGIKEKVATYKKPVVEIVDLTDDKQVKTWSNGNDEKGNWHVIDSKINGEWSGADWKKGDKIDLSELAQNKEFLTIDGALEIEVPDGATATIKVYDAEATVATVAPATTATAPATTATAPAATATATAVAATTPAVEATEEPAPTAKPEPDNAKDGHQAFLMFTDSNWKWGCWNANVGEDAVVTGNGTYTVSIKKSDFKASDVAEPAKGATVFCVDILGMCNSQKFDASKAAISDVVIKCDGKEFKADASKMYEGDIEGKGNYRLEICNEYGWGNGDFLTKDEFDPDGEFGFEESLSVTFTVKGIKEGTTPKDAFVTTDESGEEISVVSVVGVGAKENVTTSAPSGSPEGVASSAPTGSPEAAASSAPTGSPEAAASSAPSGGSEATSSSAPSGSPKVTATTVPTRRPQTTASPKPTTSTAKIKLLIV